MLHAQPALHAAAWAGCLLHKRVSALPVPPQGRARRESNVASGGRPGPTGAVVGRSTRRMTSRVCCISRRHAGLADDALLCGDGETLVRVAGSLRRYLWEAVHRRCPG